MKYKGLIIITTIVFFLLINTSYFWAGDLGVYAIPAFLVLALIFIALSVVFFQQLHFAIKEKFANRFRLFTLVFGIAVLCLTFFFPFGFINFDKLSGEDLLIAHREGAANCMTTFKLKDNHTFIERNVCFGVTETKGSYKIIHDTIYFDKVELSRYDDGFYTFAVIKPSKSVNSKILGNLVRYKNINDTVGHELWIVKNELKNLKEKL